MNGWTVAIRLLGLHVAFWAALTVAGCKPTDEGRATTQPAGPGGARAGGSQPAGLLIASYEPTVELYQDLNAAFEQHWKEKTGQTIDVETAHGPSGSQAKKIVEGNAVDIAALSVDFDIDKIAEKGLTPAEWRARYPNDSVPYSSAVLFLTRAGNPKGIKDWEDLARDDVVGCAPDPKTGGGARWIYLSAWAHALRKGGSEDQAREFTKQVYDKAVLDRAMRESTNTFVKGKGDVLFGWENEILQIAANPDVAADYELVVPSDSITIEVPIALVDRVVDQRGTRELADAFVKFLYSEAGQDIAAKRFHRVSNTAVAEKYGHLFKPLKLFRFKDHFTTWPQVMKTHFDTGGELDKMRGG